MKNILEKIRNDAVKYETSGINKEDIKIGDIDVRYFEIEADIDKIKWGYWYVPFGYIYTIDKCLILFCLNKHKDLAFDVIKNFQDDLFSQDCIDYVHNKISDDMQKMFDIIPIPKMGSNYTLVYAISDKSGLHLSKKQNTSVKFDENTNYDCICMKVDKTNLFYGTVIDNNVVSIAAWGGRPDDEIKVIGVETHEDYRNRGYAVSNVVAMAEYMLNAGKIVIYDTNKNNIASQKTAMAAGLSEAAKIQRFWFEKNK